MLKKKFDNFWRYRNLLYQLVKKGIVLKYRRSYLGIVWSLLEPVLTTMVLTVVFGTLFAKDDKYFSLYILCGRLLYSQFSSGTKRALRSIRANAGMIKKVYVPKYLYPMADVLYNYIIFLISLLVLAIWGLALGKAPTPSWLLMILPLGTLLILTYGVGMILATVGVFFRDMEYLWDVFLMIIMYTCAIFYYPTRLLKSGYSFVLNYNPLYGLICNMRHIVFREALEWDRLAFSFIVAIISLLVGVYVFNKKQDDFILYI